MMGQYWLRKTKLSDQPSKGATEFLKNYLMEFSNFFYDHSTYTVAAEGMKSWGLGMAIPVHRAKHNQSMLFWGLRALSYHVDLCVITDDVTKCILRGACSAPPF